MYVVRVGLAYANKVPKLNWLLRLEFLDLIGVSVVNDLLQSTNVNLIIHLCNVLVHFTRT